MLPFGAEQLDGGDDMRIFDKHDRELQSIDEKSGYLVKDSRFLMHHEAVEAREERGHWVTIKEYPNGGKDVDWVIDEPATEAREAWDEYEPIMRFVEFTQTEIGERRIAELKGLLQSTDYMVLKVIEGATTLAEIAETVKKRAAWRKEINEIEEAERNRGNE